MLYCIQAYIAYSLLIISSWQSDFKQVDTVFSSSMYSTLCSQTQWIIFLTTIKVHSNNYKKATSLLGGYRDMLTREFWNKESLWVVGVRGYAPPGKFLKCILAKLPCVQIHTYTNATTKKLNKYWYQGSERTKLCCIKIIIYFSPPHHKKNIKLILK